MIPEGFQYFLDDFWNFQFVHQVLTLTSPYLSLKDIKDMKKQMGTSLNNIIVAYLNFIFRQFRKRRAPTNDEDPFNKTFKILNMGPIPNNKT